MHSNRSTPAARVADFLANHRIEPSFNVARDGTVEVGRPFRDPGVVRELRSVLEDLRPWRKGPYRICGIDIDAEWRSEMKWDRILSLLRDVDRRSVCDIGCNNGYYMFRLAEQGAGYVRGLDPAELGDAQFQLLVAAAGDLSLRMDPVGLEQLEHETETYSLIMLMGILYHHTDPMGVLRMCRDKLDSGGEILLETIVVPGDLDVAWVPRGRYAAARGFYFLPTVPCLMSWIRRSNLRVIDEVPLTRTTPEEQRRTEWRGGNSLAEGLDPEDPSLTVEGYPAPLRGAWLLRR